MISNKIYVVIMMIAITTNVVNCSCRTVINYKNALSNYVIIVLHCLINNFILHKSMESRFSG